MTNKRIMLYLVLPYRCICCIKRMKINNMPTVYL